MRLIARAAGILRALADQPRGLSLGELAKATGLARATVQRIVGALEAERLVSTSPNLPGVRLGVEISRLASFVHLDARDLFRPFIEEVLRRAQETVDLTILNDDVAIVIDQLASTQSLRVVSHLGRPLPLHCTASGKAHLSQLDDARKRELIRGPLERFSPNTKTSTEEIIAEIDASLRRGCFIDNEEFATDVCAIAIAVDGPAAGNFAIAISMPIQRFAENFDRYSSILLDIKRSIAMRLEGYRFAERT
jgi:DNA-binding IclR family transcriptional regulator